MDVLGLEADIDDIEASPGAAPLAPDAGAIEAAAKLLAAAAHPVIVAGGGALHAGAALREVAEMLQAPVISRRMGRGILDDRHPLAVTQPAGARLWKHADAVVAVGTRFRHYRVAWGTAGLETVRIDVDPAQMHRLGRPTISILADAKVGLEALGGALRRLVDGRPSRAGEVEEVKAAAHREMQAKAGAQIEFLDALRTALPEDGIFVDEMTQMGYVSQSAFPVHAPRTFISSGYQGTLGGRLPDRPRSAGRLSRPRGALDQRRRRVHVQRAGALHRGAATPRGGGGVVFEDGAYGNVKRMQEDLYGGRVIASELHNPDFVRYAESFGGRGGCAWTRRTRCAMPSPTRGGGASRPSSACAWAGSRSRSTRCCRWRPCARSERGARKPSPTEPAPGNRVRPAGFPSPGRTPSRILRRFERRGLEREPAHDGPRSPYTRLTAGFRRRHSNGRRCPQHARTLHARVACYPRSPFPGTRRRKR